MKDGDAVRDGNGTLCYGTCDHDKREIDISAETDPEHAKSTLMHEITHAIDWNAGNTLVESQVHAVSIGVYGMLKDNKKVRQYLFGDE